MKKIIHSIIALLLSATVFAQAPESFKYQAVARDASGEVMANQQVNFQFSILEGSASGTAVYIEQHTDTTNQFGLINLVIGNGSVLLGDFASVDWGNNNYFLKVELNGVHIGTSQLLSVPYALHAKTVKSITETDPLFGTHAANRITTTNITNWTAAYGWGDHSTPGYITDGNTGWDNSYGFITASSSELLTNKSGNISMWTNDAGYLTGFTEADPIYTAWDKSSGISITESQITDLDHFTTTDETDQIFIASPANGITSTNITNWNTAYTDRLKWDGGSSGLNAATGRTSLGLGSLSTLSSINNSNWSGADLSIGNGGTGASNEADARTNLGLVIGTNVQAYNADLTDLADGTLSASKVQYNQYFITSAGTSGQVWQSDGSGRGVWVTGTELAIGDSYGGGVIFWLDASGKHGLIAATIDQSTGIQWYNGTNRYTGTTGDGLYAGEMNTAMIVATQMADNQTGNFAAKVCADYSVTVGGVTYGDWYLPSKYELNLMYLQKTTIGGFASYDYWSSTERSYVDVACKQNFDYGAQFGNGKHYAGYVRAIRAF